MLKPVSAFCMFIVDLCLWQARKHRSFTGVRQSCKKELYQPNSTCTLVVSDQLYPHIGMTSQQFEISLRVFWSCLILRDYRGLLLEISSYYMWLPGSSLGTGAHGVKGWNGKVFTCNCRFIRFTSRFKLQVYVIPWWTHVWKIEVTWSGYTDWHVFAVVALLK